MTINIEELKILNSETIGLLTEENLLNQLVSKLIVNKICDGIPLNAEETSLFKTNLFKSEKIKDEDQFQNWLSNKSITEKDLLRKATRPLKINKHCLEEFSSRVHAHFL